MKKSAKNIEEVKTFVSSLSGQSLKISVNKGRKKIVRYHGQILAVYPQVFTLKIDGDKHLDLLSCSYSDVICGDVKLAVVS